MSIISRPPIDSVYRRLIQFNDLMVGVKTTLGARNKDKTRKSPISGFTYETKKYTDVKDVTSLFLNSYDYLVLEHAKDKESKMLLNIEESYKLRWLLEASYDWLEEEGLWHYEKNSLYLDFKSTQEKKKKVLTLKTFFNDALIITPSVLHNETGMGKDKPAIEFHFSKQDISTYLSKVNVAVFIDLLTNLNLPLMGQLLFNLACTVKTNKIGYSVTDSSYGVTNEESIQPKSGKRGRLNLEDLE